MALSSTRKKKKKGSILSQRDPNWQGWWRQEGRCAYWGRQRITNALAFPETEGWIQPHPQTRLKSKSLLTGGVSAEAHRSEVSETPLGFLEQAGGTALPKFLPRLKRCRAAAGSDFPRPRLDLPGRLSVKCWRASGAGEWLRGGGGRDSPRSLIGWTAELAGRVGGEPREGGAPREPRAPLQRGPSSGHREDVGLGLEGSGWLAHGNCPHRWAACPGVPPTPPLPSEPSPGHCSFCSPAPRSHQVFKSYTSFKARVPPKPRGQNISPRLPSWNTCWQHSTSSR